MLASKLNWRRGFAVPMALVLVALLAWMPAAVAQDGRALTSGEPVSGTLSAASGAASYVFDAAPGATVSARVTSSASPLALLLSDSAGNTVAQGVDNAGTQSLSLMEVSSAAGGRYHVFVYFAPGAQVDDTAFELSLTQSIDPAAAAPPAQAGADEAPGLILLGAGIEVRLSWTGAADLNLEVRDPTGAALHWNSRTTDSGGVFGFDANGLCAVLSDSPVETATWQPGYLSAGSYEIIVYYNEACQAQTGAVQFFVDVTVDGQPSGRLSSTLSPGGQGQADIYVGRFIIASDGSATVSAGGAYPSSSQTQLPGNYTAVAANAQPIARGETVAGEITNAQPALAYRFAGTAEEVVSIDMQAVGPNLDTFLQLVDPSGAVVNINDDSGGTTNSSIANARLLNSGLYTIIASRYAKEFGGTVGQFELTVSSGSSAAAGVASAVSLPQGDIEVTVYWSTSADLQLLVRDPLGESVYDDNPSVSSGGILAEDGNVNCVAAASGAPVSHIYWPPGRLRPGAYEVEVWYQNACSELPPPVDFALVIEVGGRPLVNQVQFPLPGQRFLTNFTVEPSGVATAGEAGFIDAGSRTLPYQSEAFDPPSIDFGQTVSGVISGDNSFDVYGFNGVAGETISISMASLSLDTNLYLISPGRPRAGCQR